MCVASGNPRRVQRRRKAGGRAVGVPPTDSANKSHPRLHNRFAMLSKLTARSAIPPFELRFNPSTSINGAAYSPDSHNPMLGQAMVSGLFSAWSGSVRVMWRGLNRLPNAPVLRTYVCVKLSDL